MEKLSARERELVALKFFAGLSTAEIASVIAVCRANGGDAGPPDDREAEEGLR